MYFYLSYSSLHFLLPLFHFYLQSSCIIGLFPYTVLCMNELFPLEIAPVGCMGYGQVVYTEDEFHEALKRLMGISPVGKVNIKKS